MLALIAVPSAARADFEVTGGEAMEGQPVEFGLTTGCVFGCTLWWYSEDGSAVAGNCNAQDYLPWSQGAPGQASVGTFKHPVGTGTCDDDVYEYGSETFSLVVSDRDNFPGDRTKRATGTVQDNENPPQVAINSANATEGDAGVTALTFTLQKLQKASREISVAWRTVAGSAGSADFNGANGTVTWGALDASDKTVSVNLIGDLLDEPDESFAVVLESPINTGLDPARSTATATINDNDLPPSVSVGDVKLEEGNAGITTANVPVTLSRASGKQVKVRWATAAASAASNVDFLPQGPTEIVFNPGETAKTIPARIIADQFDEPDETFTVNLSQPENVVLAKPAGTVTIDNDDLPVPTVSIGDAVTKEGGAGPTTVGLEVRLSSGYDKPATVAYSTADGSARAPSDYLPAQGTLTFAAGETRQTINVQVLGDGQDEPDEGFAVDLRDAVNGVLVRSRGTVSITDDDLPPETDVDGDTFSEAEGDCDDNNASMNPIAVEIRGNAVDENCDKHADPFAVVTASATLTGQRARSRRRVNILAMRAVDLRAGDTLIAGCPRRKCSKNLRFRRTVTTAKSIYRLDKVVAGGWVRVGAALTVRIQRDDHATKVHKWTMRKAGKIPWAASRQCVLPGKAGRDRECDGWPDSAKP